MNRAFARLAIVLAGIVATGIAAPASQANTVVRMNFDVSVNTTAGPLSFVEIELFDSAAPITVANFLQYVNGGLYDGTILHRSVPGFIVQGGGFTPTVAQGAVNALNPITNLGAIQNEYSSTRSNVAGTIAMAKLGGDPNSASNQWFFNVGNNSSNLDNQNGGFTVFGRVLGNGMEFINAINSQTPTNISSSFNDTFKEVPMVANGGNNIFNGKSFITLTSADVVPPGSLSGFVYVDSNLDGVMDGTDYVIAEAKVSLVKDGTTVATVYSNADGSYNFGNLRGGTYSIKMETPTYLPGQASSGKQIVLDENGNLVSSGSAGTVVQNTFSNITLREGDKGLSFNFGQSAYPVALMSARMLLDSSSPIPLATAVPTLETNADSNSSLNFGYVLVGKSDSEALTVSNLGSEGCVLHGSMSGAGDEFGPTTVQTFSPLESGEKASRQYTYTPTARGADTKAVTVTTNGGNAVVSLAGTGVAPVVDVDTTAADAGLVRIGTTAEVSVTIKNIGDGNLSGLGAQSNLNGTVPVASGVFSGTGGSVSLADGGSTAFSFLYAPTTHVAHQSTVAMNFSNGSADGANKAGIVNAILTGQGVGPDYFSSLAPDSVLDFGNVPAASPMSLLLNISNASTDDNGGISQLTDLTILSASITGVDADLFSVLGLIDGTVLSKQGDLDLEILYNGTGAHGERSALLTIFTDQGAAYGGNGASFEYEIKATLAPEPGTLVLLGMGGLLLGGYAWRRRRANAAR